MRKQYHTRIVGDDRHTWDVHRLIRLATPLPVSFRPLGTFAELDELWWYQDEHDRPTPRSIAYHMHLAGEADLRWPVILCAQGRLMDGMHRLLKALHLGQNDIAAVRFTKTPAPDFINVDVSTLPYPDEDV